MTSFSWFRSLFASALAVAAFACAAAEQPPPPPPPTPVVADPAAPAPTLAATPAAPAGAPPTPPPLGVDIYRAEISSPPVEGARSAEAGAGRIEGPSRVNSGHRPYDLNTLSGGSRSDSAEALQEEAPESSSPMSAAAEPVPTGGARFPYRPIPGSPFQGESVLDRTAVIGASYVYEARSVTLAPGKGLRESASSGTVTVAFKDLFAPGPPTLVTALPSGAGEPASILVAWSSPIEADVAGYRVYRAEGDAAFVLGATVSSPQIEWTDTKVNRGTRYQIGRAHV